MLTRRKGIIAFLLAAILVTGSTPGFLPSAAGQSPTREKPKLKDFGQSLKRLKWDPQVNAAVETRDAKKKDVADSELDVVKVETSLVVGDFLIVDAQERPVKGLTQSDLILTEEGRVQEVSVFSLGNDVAVARSIVLIIDYSSSQFPYIKTSVEAAKLLVDKLSPLDMMAIVTDDVELLSDFTADKQKLKDKLSSLQKKAEGASGILSRNRKFGLSRQYSALMASLKEAFDDEDVRPIVIFQTDGDEVSELRGSDRNQYVLPLPIPPNLNKEQQEQLEKVRQEQAKNIREFSLEDVYRAAEDSRATIYTVIPGFRFVGLPPDEQVKQFKASFEQAFATWSTQSPRSGRAPGTGNGLPRGMQTPAVLERVTRIARVQRALSQVSTVTGGLTAFLERPEEADAIYTRILADINQRYVIGYYPKNKDHDGKRRRVKVEVRGHPEYLILGRKAYYAPGPD